MPEYTLHTSYIWFNGFIVSNVDVDYFSRGTCRRVLSVYLQRAVRELQEEVTRGWTVLVGQMETYVLLLSHVVLMPRLDGEIELWHVLILSAKVKTHSSFTQQPFPCLLTHGYTQQTGSVQRLERNHFPNPLKKIFKKGNVLTERTVSGDRLGRDGQRMDGKEGRIQSLITSCIFRTIYNCSLRLRKVIIRA